MADVMENNNEVQTKAFLLKKAFEKSSSRRLMQIALNYLVSRRKRLINVFAQSNLGKQTLL